MDARVTRAEEAGIAPPPFHQSFSFSLLLSRQELMQKVYEP